MGGGQCPWPECVNQTLHIELQCLDSVFERSVSLKNVAFLTHV